MNLSTSANLYRLIHITIFVLLLLPGALYADEDDMWLSVNNAGDRQVNIHFFWSPRCPHCQEARPHVETIPQSHPWIILHSYNVIENQRNRVIFRKMAESIGREATSVPSFFVCGQMMTGWDSPRGRGAELIAAAETCRSSGQIQQQASIDQLQLPLLGSMKPDEYSLPLFTLIIAGLDAFNPCAFFVLLFLLSLLVHAQSRLRMLAIGGTFVLISGVLYFVFMAAWLNFFFLAGNVEWITLVAGIIAVIIGAFGIKDFLLAYRGPSLSISDERKSRLYVRMRNLLSIDSMPTLVLGTIMLALAANTYELLCTAGFPMVYTRVLTLHEMSAGSYYLYLAFYNLVYVIPLVVIVVFFTITLGSRKLSAEEGRLLKLLSGVMMLELGLVLLVFPDLLSKIYTGIFLLLSSVALTLLARAYLHTRTQ